MSLVTLLATGVEKSFRLYFQEGLEQKEVRTKYTLIIFAGRQEKSRSDLFNNHFRAEEYRAEDSQRIFGRNMRHSWPETLRKRVRKILDEIEIY